MSKGKRLTAILLAAVLGLSGTVSAAAATPDAAEKKTVSAKPASVATESGSPEESMEIEEEYPESDDTSEENTVVDAQQEEGPEEIIGTDQETEQDTDSVNIETATPDETEDAAVETAETGITVNSVITEEGSGVFRITVSGIEDNYPDAEAVSLNVWSMSDKSNLFTYQTQQSDGDYYADACISNHNYAIGTYQIVAEVTDSDGQTLEAGTAEQVISMDCSKRKITDVSDGAQTKFKLTVSGLKNYTAVTAVQALLWSDEDGKDDKHWITLSGSKGSYKQYFDTSGFADNGLCHASLYARMKDGSRKRFDSIDFELTKAAVEKVTTTVNQNNGYFRVTMNGVTVPPGIDRIYVKIWHKSDKSDIKKLTAVQSGSSYYVRTDISSFGRALGSYHAAIYVKDKNGFYTKAVTKSFSVALDPGTFCDVVSKSQGITWLAKLTDAKLCNLASAVKFAVWSEKGGQDDLNWYTAKQNASGSYYYYIPICNHMATGTYQVHAYLEKSNGKMIFLNKTSFSVSTLPEEEITISDKASNGSQFTATVTVLRPTSQFSKIQIPVWCSSDQSDLVWYTAEKVSTGKYAVTVKASNHQYHFGTYHIAAYMKKKDGTQVGLSSTTTELKAKNYVVKEQASTASCTITIYGATLNGKTPDTVYFPTWSKKDGQDDLVWYKGSDDGDGNFSVTIYRSQHAHDGYYYTHIYLCIGSTQTYLRQVTCKMKGASGYDSYAQEVMRKIIYAVETGGQVYGNARYDDFTMAYTNSSNEHAITIGAGCWYAGEAKRLLSLIRSKYPSDFKANDTAGIGNDLDNCNWSTYGTDGNGNRTIVKGSAKAVAIQNIINSAGGRKIQDQLVDEQMAQYVSEAEALGVTDLKARMFLANIRHLGGYGPMKWVVELCIGDGKSLTMKNLYDSMRAHTTNPNGVGADLYNSRHVKVMGWLDQYIG